MDINFLGLTGSVIRLVFVFRFNYKKQNEAAKNNFEKEEKKDVLIGSITIVVIMFTGLLITFFEI